MSDAPATPQRQIGRGTPDTQSQLEVRTVPNLNELDRSAWQALAGAEHPFSSWDFLAGLERTRCVCPERGWLPQHLTLWQDSILVAAAPAYVKGDGMGDFSRDWSFQHALQQLGGTVYPKLVVGIPFSPVTSPRILVAPDFDSALAARLLMDLGREVVQANRLGSIQVLYHTAAEAQLLADANMATRTLIQYHWRSYDYASSEDWLARLPGRKRKQIRKERRAPQSQGITIDTWRHGDQDDLHALAGTPADISVLAFDLYKTTCEKYMWGGTYLNRQFFELLFTDRHLSSNLEFVVARREGSDFPSNVIAGAINLATSTHLYGRYWGCHEEHRYLHFNVCLYHSIAECIRRGVEIFEGGAGGEHKLSRGFEPTLVYNSLWFAQEHIQSAFAPALLRDAQHNQASVQEWMEKRSLATDILSPRTAGTTSTV